MRTGSDKYGLKFDYTKWQQKWAAAAGYREEDVSDIIKTVRQRKRK